MAIYGSLGIHSIGFTIKEADPLKSAEKVAEMCSILSNDDLKVAKIGARKASQPKNVDFLLNCS